MCLSCNVPSTHNGVLVGDPVQLHLAPLGVGQAGVVGGRLHAGAPQLQRQRVAVVARQAVHDARLAVTTLALYINFFALAFYIFSLYTTVERRNAISADEN